ncbi:hypothetical protein BC826DRAFT_1012318 [Russula brevipes]|nr:hypothetical protein BC826DRAFT_1012318 [Russula brevipes]
MTTTTTTAPPAAATSAWTTPFLSGGVTPIIIGLVTTGSFVLAIIAICAWRRFTGRAAVYPLPTRGSVARRWGPRRRPRTTREEEQQEQQRGEEWRRRNGGGGRGAGGKPEMFEAWTALRTTDVLNWAESPPVAATLFASHGAVQTGSLPKTDGDRGAEIEDKDEPGQRQGDGVRQCTGESVQVAVLVQMPSPTRHYEANVESLARPFHGELAVGLIEVPWTREDHPAVRRTTSITS